MGEGSSGVGMDQCLTRLIYHPPGNGVCTCLTSLANHSQGGEGKDSQGMGLVVSHSIDQSPPRVEAMHSPGDAIV